MNTADNVETRQPLPNVRKIAYLRNQREHKRQQLGSALAAFDFTPLCSLEDPIKTARFMMNTLKELYEQCCPLKSVKKSKKDPIYMSQLVMYILRQNPSMYNEGN